jgi:hypothetical protein
MVVLLARLLLANDFGFVGMVTAFTGISWMVSRSWSGNRHRPVRHGSL